MQRLLEWNLKKFGLSAFRAFVVRTKLAPPDKSSVIKCERQFLLINRNRAIRSEKKKKTIATTMKLLQKLILTIKI